jgi:hypothetical protein
MKNRPVLFLSNIENGCYEFFWKDAPFFSITTGWFSVSIQGQKRAMYIPNVSSMNSKESANER